MDKKDRDLIVKIGKRLGVIEKQHKEYTEVNEKLVKIIEKYAFKELPKPVIEKQPEINSMELEFFLQLPEKEVADISLALRNSILEIMRKVGIKQMKCNISQE